MIGNKLTQEEQAFYDRLYPCLCDRCWEYTGEIAYGMVRWWRDLARIQHEEISAIAKAGIVQRPSSAYIFVRIDTIEYPQRQYVKHLDIDPISSNATPDAVVNLAQRSAIDLLQENAEEIRQARQQWFDELEAMKQSIAREAIDRDN